MEFRRETYAICITDDVHSIPHGRDAGKRGWRVGDFGLEAALAADLGRYDVTDG